MPVWIIIVGVIALMVVGTWLGNVRKRRIARARAGEGFDDFEAHFAGRNIPREILVNTYVFFEDWNSDAIENFPVRATDNIADIYGTADEDLYDAIDEVLKKSGRRWFKETEQPELPRIETVEDLVSYVASAPLSWQ